MCGSRKLISWKARGYSAGHSNSFHIFWRVGLLLDVLGRMEVWLAHQGRTGLTPEDRVILLPRFQRLARDAGSVAALSRDFVGELERA